MLLYHGSDHVIEKPEFGAGKKQQSNKRIITHKHSINPNLSQNETD